MRKLILKSAIFFMALMMIPPTAEAQIGKLKGTLNQARGLKNSSKRKSTSSNKPTTESAPSTSGTANDSNSKAVGAVEQSKGVDAAYAKRLENASGQMITLKPYMFNSNFCNVKTQEKYSAAAKDLNFQQLQQEMNAKGKPDYNQQYQAYYQFEKLEKFPKEMEVWAEEKLKPGIMDAYKEAFKSPQLAPPLRVPQLKRCKKIVSAVLTIVPNHESTKELMVMLDKGIDKISGDYYDKIYTSEVHKEHAGEIVFSNKPIRIGSETEAQFKSSFSANEPIYAMCYLEGAIKDLGSITGNNVAAKYEIYLDGSYSTKKAFIHNDEDLENPFYFIDIKPEPAEAIHGFDPVAYGEVLSALPPTKQKVKIKFVTSSVTMAEGEFTLDWSNGDGAAVMANAKKAAGLASNNYADKMTLPSYFNKKTMSFEDPAANVSTMKSLLKSGYSNIKTIRELKILDNGGGDQWVIFKNEITNVPEKKHTRARIVAIYEGNDGYCYYVDDMTFSRVYQGGGYGKLNFISDGYHTKINCNNLP